MIHPLVKIITVDGFFSTEQATQLHNAVCNLNYVDSEFGQEIPEFNFISSDADEQFSSLLNTNMVVNEDASGKFRRPKLFIHFEGFDSTDEWIFAVALEQSTFNVYESHLGATTALDKHDLPYANLFAWDLRINYVLKPGQGVLFRPWLFHSFDTGLIQTFRLIEKDVS